MTQPGTAGTSDDPLNDVETEALTLSGTDIGRLVALCFDTANQPTALRFDGTGSSSGFFDGSAVAVVNGSVKSISGAEYVDPSGTSHTLDSWQRGSGVSATFDVTITSTTSPVNQGNTLDVTADITNSGGAQGTKTVALDINNSVGQVDSQSVTVSAGATKTKTFQWSVPSGQTAQSYQATVASPDDAASQTVTVSSLPASTVLAYDPATFTNGDSTWTDQAGTADMTINGDPQEATLSNGDPSISSDGTDDHGLTTFPGSLEGAGLENFAIEFAVEYTSTSNNHVTQGAVNSGDNQRIQILTNFDYNAGSNPTAGHIGVAVTDTNNTRLFFSPSSNPGLDDGNRHTVVVDVVDAATSNVDIYIDGSSVPLTFNTADDPSNFGTWDVDVGHFARNNGGSIDNHYPGELGKVRWHDSDIGGPTI